MSHRVLSEIYCAALPSVRGKPLRKMPRLLYAYVYKVSARQQVRLCLLTLLIFPLTLAPLELQRRIVDGAIAREDVDLLLLLGGLYFGVVAVQGTLKYLRNIYLDRVAEGVTRILRMRIARSEDFGAAADEGTKQSIISSEAEMVGGFVAESIAFPFLQVGIVLSVAGYMLLVEPAIAAVAIGFLVPSVVVVALTQPALNRLSGEKIEVTRGLAERVLEDDRSDANKLQEPERLIERIYRLRLRFVTIKHAAKAINNLINHLGPLSVLLVGGWMVIQGQTQVGTIVAFMSGYERMSGPARELLNFYRRLAMMRVQYRLVHDAGQAQPSDPA